jgi:hypothetical protein
MNRRRRPTESARGGALIALAFFTLIAFIGAVWINSTFHPAGGNILPLVALGIGFIAMIGTALE